MDKLPHNFHTHSNITQRLLGAASTLLLLAMAGLAEGAARDTELISARFRTLVAAGRSTLSSISADGRYVAFDSKSARLVSGDSNEHADIFVRDSQTGQTVRASVNSNGAQANDDSFLATLSGNGRFVAFRSYATNLVADDTNERQDIFVRDLQSGVTERVSVDSQGAQGNDESDEVAISADGRYVAFRSLASNLVPGLNDINLAIFLRDRQTGVTRQVSVSMSGGPPDGFTIYPAISADGRFVAFSSFASDLVADDTNGRIDVFIWNRQTAKIERISEGAQSGEGDSHGPSLSADGRFVAYYSSASDLVPGDTNATLDVFVKDRKTGQTELLSVSSNGVQGNQLSQYPAISADGRTVVFQSLASNLITGPGALGWGVFARDRLTGQTRLMSVNSDGVPADNSSFRPSLSADGRTVSFYSLSNLAANDSNAPGFDVYVHERTLLSFTLTPETVDFGDRALNTSTTRKVRLENTGNASLPLKAIEIAGTHPQHFSYTTTCASSLAAGARCEFIVFFKPKSRGVKSATLTARVGGGLPSLTVRLSGRGI